jgi:site-specific DNA-methyltransferase (adenine-specific)
MSEAKIIHGDGIEVMRGMAAQSVDLVFGSPPYEDARTYGIDFSLKGQAWVDWMVEVFRASLHVSRGLVAFVLEGRTQKFRWSATPALLMADLHRAGITLRKPPVFHRVGVSGGGGPDWLRNDYEFIVCATNGGKLPWSQNTAMGRLPKWAPGGEMSHRLSDGTRRNQWGGSAKSTGGERHQNGHLRVAKPKPSHTFTTKREVARTHTKRKPGGEMEVQGYNPPALANPGNVLKYNVGGGVMGDRLCHENEAPFPEKLAEFFIRSFCPPDGIVLDPFSGSGTTAKVAVACGRNAIGIDVRESQVDLSTRRIQSVQANLI